MLCEQETIVLINQADVKEGYFKLSTSRKSDAERIIRLTNNAIEPEIKTFEGKPCYWDFKMPVEYLAKNFGFKSKKQVEAAKKQSERQISAGVVPQRCQEKASNS